MSYPTLHIPSLSYPSHHVPTMLCYAMQCNTITIPITLTPFHLIVHVIPAELVATTTTTTDIPTSVTIHVTMHISGSSTRHVKKTQKPMLSVNRPLAVSSLPALPAPHIPFPFAEPHALALAPALAAVVPAAFVLADTPQAPPQVP